MSNYYTSIFKYLCLKKMWFSICKLNALQTGMQAKNVLLKTYN